MIGRNMKVHLRNVKMEICEKEKHEVGNICNKEEWNMSESVILPKNMIKIR